MDEKSGGRRQQVTIEKLATFPGDPTLRQVSGAVYIQESLPTLDSKEEWGNSNMQKRTENLTNIERWRSVTWTTCRGRASLDLKPPWRYVFFAFVSYHFTEESESKCIEYNV